MAIIKWLSNKTSCKQDRMFKLLSESVSQSKPVGQVKEKRKKERKDKRKSFKYYC